MNCVGEVGCVFCCFGCVGVVEWIGVGCSDVNWCVVVCGCGCW